MWHHVSTICNPIVLVLPESRMVIKASSIVPLHATQCKSLYLRYFSWVHQWDIVGILHRFTAMGFVVFLLHVIPPQSSYVVFTHCELF